MLKFVKQVNVSFSPLNSNSKQARTFLNRLRTDKNLSSNPKAKLIVTTLDDSEPRVKVTLVNNEEVEFDASVTKSDEMFQDLTRVFKRMQLDEDIKNAA